MDTGSGMNNAIEAIQKPVGTTCIEEINNLPGFAAAADFGVPAECATDIDAGGGQVSA
jgi:hypothetical protein